LAIPIQRDGQTCVGTKIVRSWAAFVGDGRL